MPSLPCQVLDLLAEASPSVRRLAQQISSQTSVMRKEAARTRWRTPRVPRSVQRASLRGAISISGVEIGTTQRSPAAADSPSRGPAAAPSPSRAIEAALAGGCAGTYAASSAEERVIEEERAFATLLLADVLTLRATLW